MRAKLWYAGEFGIEVDEAAWEESLEAVTDRLAEHLERATGITLTGWDSPSRGGVYYEGREKRDDGQEIQVWMRPNFAPESGDWCMDDYRTHAVIVGLFGNRQEQVEDLQRAILGSHELGATLLERTVHRSGQRREVAYSLKDVAKLSEV
ncbi:hypothetical protein [Pelagibius sp.]|uniref:hypothetical protein n=1 Tax=Pelagibius sp. TaxID=1931238 RepID=UPI003B5081FF